MEKSSWRWLPVAGIVFYVCAECCAEEAAALPQALLEKIKQHLVALSDEDFAVREHATKELEKLELKLLPIMKEMSKGVTDLEAQLRVSRLFSKHYRQDNTRRLASLVTLDFNKMPLEKVLAELTRQTGLRLVLGPQAREANAGTFPLTLKMKEVTLRSALKWVLGLSALGCTVGVHEAVLEPGESGIKGKAYPGFYSVTGLPFGNAYLCDLLRNRVLPSEFVSQTTSIESFGEDSFCAVQSGEVHAQIEAVLAKLKIQKHDQEIAFTSSEEPWRAKIHAALKNQKISFEFVDKPLRECLAEIQKHTETALILDPKSFQDGTVPPVSLRVTDMSIGLALESLLKLVDLEYSLRDEAIYIAKQLPLIENVELHILNLADLVAAPGENITVRSIADMIRIRIKPGSWDPTLGTSIEERAGKLLIMQSPKSHDAIREILGNFREFVAQRRKVEKGGQAPEKPLDPALVPTQKEKITPQPAWVNELQAALKKPFTCEFKDTPLTKVLALLGKQSGVLFLMDPQVEAEGAGKAVINLRASNRPLDLVLRNVLRQAELAFEICGTKGSTPRGDDREEHLARSEAGYLFVTKRARLEIRVKLGQFYVHDLESVLPIQVLVNLMKERLLAREFADPNTSIVEWSGTLLVMQSPEVLLRIKGVLDDFRKHYTDPFFSVTESLLTPQERSGREVLQAKLDTKVTFKLEGLTFDAVIAKIEEQTGVVLEIVNRTAESAAPIRLDVKDVPLRSALTNLFEPLLLDFRVGDGVVLVDGRDNLTVQNNEIGLHQLNGLVGEERPFLNATLLMEYVQLKTGAGQWNRAKGHGCELVGKRLMVTHQPATHAEIKKLFEALRTAGKPNK